MLTYFCRMIRVAVYDDNNERRESLRTFIQLMSGYEYAGGFENCASVVKDMEEAKPDVVLMDIEMPEVNGIEGVRLIKQYYPDVKVIMQTVFDDHDRIFAALRAGAEGYILKSASVRQITQSIEEVVNGGASMSPGIALKVIRFFGSNLENETSVKLTRKESEVLKHLSQGLSYKMVADNMNISYFTVNNHVKKIYEKLQVHSIQEAIAMAHKHRLV